MDDPGKYSAEINVENKLLYKFTIPKIKRDFDKVCIIRCKPEKREYNDILDILDKSRLNMNCELKSSWDFSELKLVSNKDLEQRFAEKRNEMKDLGRNARELEEKYCFLTVPRKLAASIANYGLASDNTSFKVLGNPQMGIHLFRHIDVALNFAHRKDLASNVVVIFKFVSLPFGMAAAPCVFSNAMAIPLPISGRPTNSRDFLRRTLPKEWKLFATKEYIEGLLPENCGHINKTGTPRKPEVLFGKARKVQVAKKTAIDPTPNFDSHISKHAPLWNDQLDEQANNSLIYIYEYDCSLKPVRIPRQCLPVASVNVTFKVQKMPIPTVKLTPKNISTGSDVLSNCTVAQRIGKGKDATVIFRSVRPPVTKPVIKEAPEISILQNESQSVPVLDMLQKTTNHIPASLPPNPATLPIERLLPSSMVITSKLIKDPRLLKRGEQDSVKADQYFTAQQNKSEILLENEVSIMTEKEQSKEMFYSLEDSLSKTPLYLSFEEARLTSVNYSGKEIKSNAMETHLQCLSLTKKCDDTCIETLENVAIMEKSDHESCQMHKVPEGDQDKIMLTQEQYSPACPKNTSAGDIKNYNDKITDNRNKFQFSIEKYQGQCGKSQIVSPESRQKETSLNQLNVSSFNDLVSPEEPILQKDIDATTTEALQMHPNMISHKEDSKECTNVNKSKLEPKDMQILLPSCKEHSDKAFPLANIILEPDMKEIIDVNHASPLNKPNFTSLQTLKTMSPKALRKSLINTSNMKTQDQILQNVWDTGKNVCSHKKIVNPHSEKEGSHKLSLKMNIVLDIPDFLCMTELENRIDWKGIFGLEKDKAEAVPEFQRSSRKLKEPSGLRIFPDMEITVANSHYVCLEKNRNMFSEVHSMMTTKEKNDDAEKANMLTENACLFGDCEQSDDQPDPHKSCINMSETVQSGKKKEILEPVTSETKNVCKLDLIKTVHIQNKILQSTKKNPLVVKRSVRRINKFSQSEKNIKVVLGMLSDEIPLCKSKRISKRLDQAILHLRKAHKRVQKSLQLVAKSGKRKGISHTLHMGGNADQEKHNNKSLKACSLVKHHGERANTKEQLDHFNAACKEKKMLYIPNSTLPDKHHQKSDKKCLIKSTLAVNGVSAQECLLPESPCKSPSPKIFPPLLLQRTISNKENAAPGCITPKNIATKKDNLTKKCDKSNTGKKGTIRCSKMFLQTKKYLLGHNKTKNPKTKTKVFQKAQQKEMKIKKGTSALTQYSEQARIFLEKISKILQKASETHNLKCLQGYRSLCKTMLPSFIKSFEYKQKCTWSNVVVDRDLCFHNQRTCFKKPLKPQAIESFLELQMMMETIQFIENRICFIEGKPRFRSLLWYDASLYTELLTGEAGYQQQSLLYTTFQKKLKHSPLKTLENQCSKLSEFLQDMHENNSSYYVYLKYKRELKECEDVLKHNCDHSQFSLSVPFTCGAHLGDTLDDLVLLQKSTLQMINKLFQLSQGDPGKKEHALCLLEIISAKINCIQSSGCIPMQLSLFGIEHLLFDAAKMMVLKERRKCDNQRKVAFTKEIISQINNAALSKLYEVFGVLGKKEFVAKNPNVFSNSIENSQENAWLSSKKHSFFVGKIIDLARCSESSLIQQMIVNCQERLDFQIKRFQILQECDTEQALIKHSNVKDLPQKRDLFTTMVKTEAVDTYIDLAMLYETLHFLNCVIASHKNQERNRGLLWFDASLLPNLLNFLENLSSILPGNVMSSALDLDNAISALKSEMDVISNCSGSVNYSYAFQIMTRELSELTELKTCSLTSKLTVDAYIHLPPCVVSLYYGATPAELDYNYNQFSDYLDILRSASIKDLGKMAHTMAIMRTIEFTKALTIRTDCSSLDFIMCQMQQFRKKCGNIVKQTENKRETLNVQSPKKRKYASQESISPKKEKLSSTHKLSPGNEKKEKLALNLSPPKMNISQLKESRSSLKKHCMKSSLQNENKVATRPNKQESANSIECNKIIPNTRRGSSSLSSTKANEISLESPDRLCATHSKDLPYKCPDVIKVTGPENKHITVPSNDIFTAEKADSQLSNNNDVVSIAESPIVSDFFEEHSNSQENALPTTENNSLAEVEKQNGSSLTSQRLMQINSNEQTKQLATPRSSIYSQYPGSSNPWHHSLYVWYENGGHNNTASQLYQGGPYNSQNTNPYSQASVFPVPNSYSNFSNQVQPHMYSASCPFGTSVPYQYSEPSSVSYQNGVPYSDSSRLMATPTWSWNSWQ